MVSYLAMLQHALHQSANELHVHSFARIGDHCNTPLASTIEPRCLLSVMSLTNVTPFKRQVTAAQGMNPDEQIQFVESILQNY